MTATPAHPIVSRLPNVGTTIFTTMSQLALDHQAINLGQGFPDFNPDARLVQLVTDAMNAGHNQYPAMAGVPALRQAISDKVATLYGHRYQPDTEITVTSGATEALMSAIFATVHPGDEVIVLEPAYDLYLPVIALAGGKAVTVPMMPPDASSNQYRVDWDRVNDAITPNTRMLMLNFPHNPTGVCLTEDDLDTLESLIAKHPLWLLSDEAYEHIVFDGVPHLSLASRPALADRTLVIYSFGKTYHTTGWKVGYCCAPRALTTELRKVHQFAVFTVSSPMQHALAAYMQDAATYTGLSAFYQDKRDLMMAGLQSTRFQPLPSQGTFFLLASYAGISELPEQAFAKWLTTTHGVTVIPVSAFYEQPDAPVANHQLVRFCFAKQDATLEQALAKLRAV